MLNHLINLFLLLPRPARFLVIGSVGLVTDVGIFTSVAAFGPHPLIARGISLVIATLVTWRFNQALTFEATGRRQHEEALRYAIVTAIAQGTSYGVFAALVLTALSSLPQLAILIGSAIGALVSYKGHHLLSFAPNTILKS
jgi:putative flippase GtrA